MSLTSLDLFSGIGGLTHALRGLNITPVGYCDCDKTAAKVLKSRMASGDLPKAPVYDDVATLTKDSFDAPIDIIMGGFPCFPAGTPVLTDKGYMSIESVSHDELLLTHTGSWKPIENIQRKMFSRRMARVSIRRHFQAIHCTDNHPFYARLVHGDGDPCWVAARDLTTDHCVGFPINTQAVIPTFKVPFGRRSCQTIKAITLDDPEQWYMMGVFLGDGWNQESKKKSGPLRYRIAFIVNHRQEVEIMKRLSKVMSFCKGDVNANCTKYIAANKMWWTILNDFGKYAHGKKIPEWVHAAPVHLVEKFVEGYMASDGCKRPGSSLNEEWRFATVSQDIALGLQRLLSKLGYCFGTGKTTRKPTTIIKGRVVNQRPSFSIEGRVPLLRRNTCSFIEGGYVWYRVTDVAFYQPEAPLWVYNFQVADDHSYIVQNVVVKNCTGLSVAGLRQGFDNPGTSLYKHIVQGPHVGHTAVVTYADTGSLRW